MHRGKCHHHKATTTPPCESNQKQIPLKMMKKLAGGGKLLSPRKWKLPLGFTLIYCTSFSQGFPAIWKLLQALYFSSIKPTVSTGHFCSAVPLKWIWMHCNLRTKCRRINAGKKLFVLVKQINTMPGYPKSTDMIQVKLFKIHPYDCYFSCMYTFIVFIHILNDLFLYFQFSKSFCYVVMIFALFFQVSVFHIIFRFYVISALF